MLSIRTLMAAITFLMISAGIVSAQDPFSPACSTPSAGDQVSLQPGTNVRISGLVNSVTANIVVNVIAVDGTTITAEYAGTNGPVLLEYTVSCQASITDPFTAAGGVTKTCPAGLEDGSPFLYDFSAPNLRESAISAQVLLAQKEFSPSDETWGNAIQALLTEADVELDPEGIVSMGMTVPVVHKLLYLIRNDQLQPADLQWFGTTQSSDLIDLNYLGDKTIWPTDSEYSIMASAGLDSVNSQLLTEVAETVLWNPTMFLAGTTITLIDGTPEEQVAQLMLDMRAGGVTELETILENLNQVNDGTLRIFSQQGPITVDEFILIWIGYRNLWCEYVPGNPPVPTEIGGTEG